MNGWIIYNKIDAIENETYINWFIDEAKNQQINLQLVLREHLQIQINNGKYEIIERNNHNPLPDFVIIRTIEPILQAMFEQFSIPTFNNSFISNVANHKSWMHFELAKLNIPMLTTIFTTKQGLPEDPPLPFPFVIKEATGRSGKQVFYIKSSDDWRTVTNRIVTNDLLIQPADVKLGKDVRVFVIGKEIIAAVLRDNKKDFRANFKLGGDAVLYELSADDKQLIQSIINHFNFGLVGIDFLLSHEGKLLFNEVEDVVGSRILSKTTKINLLEKYITHIKGEVARQSKTSFIS